MFKNIFINNSKVYLWETYNGKTVRSEEEADDFYFYKSSPHETDQTTFECGLKDIYGNNVSEVGPMKLTQLKKIGKEYKEMGYRTYNSDLSPEMLFLQKRYKDLDSKPNMDDYNVAIWDIEIEVQSEFPKPEEVKYPVNLIAIYSSKTKKYTVFGNRPYNGDTEKHDIDTYYCITDEKDMLETFILWWRKQKFDIVTGWNCKNFDFQYVIKRAAKLGIQKSFSPINVINHRNVIDKSTGIDTFSCTIAGLSILDYKDLFEKFTYETLESYSLQFVSQHLGLDGKVDLDGAINDAYIRDWDKFVEYCIHDVRLVKQIDDKLKFIELTVSLCYEALIPFEKVFSSVATIEGYMFRYMSDNKLVLEDRKKLGPDLWFEYGLWKTENGLQNVKEDQKIFEPYYVKGGHVEAYPGLYDYVMSFDFESLYPKNILQFYISPENKVFNPTEEQIKEEDLIKSPVNGICYRKNKSAILPTIVDKVFAERKKFKNLMFEENKKGNKVMEDYYDRMQLIRKILINSMYGVMINEYFHFYDPDLARTVTRTGRELIRFMSTSFEDYFHNYFHKVAKKYFPNTEAKPLKNKMVSVIDTDSNYIQFKELKEVYSPESSWKEFSTIVEEKIVTPLINNLLKIFAEKYDVEQIQYFKREGIIEKQFVQAKKKYITILNQKESKMYWDKPKLSATGVEIKRSDTPRFVRTTVEDLINEIFYKQRDEVNEFLKQNQKQFRKQNIEDIAFNKAVKTYTKYFTGYGQYLPSTPIHNRAAINYNNLIDAKKLPYLKVDNGTKVKFYFCTKKNFIDQDVVAFVGNCPKEILEEFKIDYDKQYEKSMLSIANRFAEVLNWDPFQLKESKMSKLFF